MRLGSSLQGALLLPDHRQRPLSQRHRLHRRREAHPRRQPRRRPLRHRAQPRLLHALRPRLLRLPRQNRGLPRHRHHLLPPPGQPPAGADARGRARGGRAAGAGQVRRAPALGEEQARRVRGGEGEAWGEGGGVREGDGQVRRPGAVLVGVDGRAAGAPGEGGVGGGQRLRAGGALHLLGRQPLRAGPGISLPAGESVPRSSRVPENRRRRRSSSK